MRRPSPQPPCQQLLARAGTGTTVAWPGSWSHPLQSSIRNRSHRVGVAPPTAQVALSLELRQLEALLWVADQPVTVRKLQRDLDWPVEEEVLRALVQLNTFYQQTGSAFQIQELAGGYQLLTLAELQPALEGLAGLPEEPALSKPALETLAVIAYRQPITRAEVERLRGIPVLEMLKQLQERGLIRLAGREESLGRPFLFATTRHFLQVFGLNSLADLPGAGLLPFHDATPPESHLASDSEETGAAA